MASYQILYNPLSNNKQGANEVKQLDDILKDNTLNYIDITTIKSYEDFFAGLTPWDKLVIAGGDGTLNRFVNDTNGLKLPEEIYYFATGSGNDFFTDIGHKRGDAPVEISKYLKDLPTVIVNGKTSLFINGIGFGIDGYCCEVGDQLKETSDKPINYAGIAIKGLLFHYKPTNAEITVDGIQKSYGKVWLAPTMHGRYYGGGMIPTPEQDRLNVGGIVSTMVYYGSGKLKSLIVFPSIFKGEHVKHTEMIEVLTGREVTVTFDRPVALQIDGETVLGVTTYTVKSAK